MYPEMCQVNLISNRRNKFLIYTRIHKCIYKFITSYIRQCLHLILKYCLVVCGFIIQVYYISLTQMSRWKNYPLVNDKHWLCKLTRERLLSAVWQTTKNFTHVKHYIIRYAVINLTKSVGSFLFSRFRSFLAVRILTPIVGVRQ